MSNTNQLANTKQMFPTTSAIDRVKAFWVTRTSKQKLYLAVGSAITVATLVLLTQMAMAPDYKPLMSGLETADAQAISSQLAAKKISFLLAPDGTSISVPADQVDAARLEIASHETPHSGRLGFEIFDKVSWGQTEFDEKVNYQRALEGELERTIKSMSNIKSARVHLVMAKDSVFMDRERGAKASVTVSLNRGTLSREQLGAITRLVAGAVEELKPGDVAIIDSDSNQTLSSLSDLSSSRMEEQALTQRLVSTLSPVVGADHIRATVNIEYETGSSEESQEKYDPAVSIPLNTQRTEESATGGAVNGGVPGTSSNVIAAKPAKTTVKDAVQPQKEPGQSSKSESATYGVNRTTRHVIEPAGGIKRLTAAVLVDDLIDHTQEKGKWVEIYRKRSPEELKLITELAEAAIGFNSGRNDVISVQNLSFSRQPSNESPAVTFADKTREGLRDYSSVIRYCSLSMLFGLVYLLMIRPIQKQALLGPDSLGNLSHPQVDRELERGAVGGNSSLLAQRTLLLRKQLSEFVQSEPENSTVAVRAWLQEETP
jgi:flagellar M-ring protein FliF